MMIVVLSDSVDLSLVRLDPVDIASDAVLFGKLDFNMNIQVYIVKQP